MAMEQALALDAKNGYTLWQIQGQRIAEYQSGIQDFTRWDKSSLKPPMGAMPYDI